MLHLSRPAILFMVRHTDMRKGFDSLSGIVSSKMNQDALSGAVFIFFNKKHNQVKLLLWEGDGFALYHKRLEQGTYELPSYDDKTASLSISSHATTTHTAGHLVKECQRRKRYQHMT